MSTLPHLPISSVAFITEKVLNFNSFFESLMLVPQSSDTEVIYTKGDDEEVMFIELIRKNDESRKENMKRKGVQQPKGSIVDPWLSQVVLVRPFVKISNMTHEPPEGVVRFTNRNDEVSYKIPYKIEQYNSLSNLEKEHTKSVYLRNKEDKRRDTEYVMSKILGFYKECLELGPEYLTGMDDEGEVT
nr:retrotransposon Orf1 [Tanacetum cinerariifolium]